MKKTFWTVFFLSIFISFAGTQTSDKGLKSYSQKNPSAFRDAMKFSIQLKFYMQALGYEDCDLALAVVFPELMRYSAYRDEIESFATEIAYTASMDFEGFSIGHFQMKPVFAEMVENCVEGSPKLKKKYSVIDYGGDTSTIIQRRNRIRRLQTLESEVAYLYAFIDICREKLALEESDDGERVGLIASAYNAGFCYKKDTLEKIGRVNSFPNGSGKSPSWNYVQIASDYYKLSKKIKPSSHKFSAW
ncbi:MAG: hypothetical protein J6S91_11795 [Treponema sp.]|nr:hypothetical protein [Treponema sp.]